MKRFLLVGGGSGGHFYPLIAIAQRLRSENNQDPYELFYMGPEPYDSAALADTGITFVYCPAGKQRRYFSLLNYFGVLQTIAGFFVAIYRLYLLYPDVVMSKGSASSVPVVLAAWCLRIPIVIHESDSKPGRANALAAHFARFIGISFASAAPFFPEEKTALIGVPLRTAFLTKTQDPHTSLGIPNDRPVLFVTGGSLGAERINNLILHSLDELLPHYTIIHQTGKIHEATVEQTAASLVSDSSLLEHYFVRGNLTAEDMDHAQSIAALIISRAGAGTIFEIAQKGVPSIIIPIPEHISHDQRTNAYEYARGGACVVLEEENLIDDLLLQEVMRIMSDTSVQASMRQAAQAFAKQDAATELAKTLIAIANEHD